MTQASLSPDLNGALGASPSADPHARTGQTSESALWITALAATGLLVAAVLLVGVLARSASTDASFGGFVSGVSIMIAAFGIGALAYVLVTARRQGSLHASHRTATVERVAPSGMHVVPALPAEMGRRKRRQLEAERSERSRQAKAIATATPAPAKPRPLVATHTAPHQAGVARPSPRPVHTSRQAVPPPARAARPVPAVPARPAIRMPRPQVRQPRPRAWPTRAPVVRMATPPTMRRTRVVSQQVNAATVRMQAPHARR